MRRREFIKLLSVATAVRPFVAEAQQAAMPVVGFLSGRSLSSDAHLVKAFRNGLNDAGFVEGQNVVIEFRWAEGKSGRIAAFVKDVVSNHHVAVVFAGAIDNSISELRASLPNTPAVFAIGGDPVVLGIAASLARPGGNVTGMTVMSAALWPKLLTFLRELVGQTDLVAVLIDPANETAALATTDVESAAKAIGQRIVLLNAKSESDFEAVFATIVQDRAGALLVPNDPVFINGRKKLIELAATHAVPVIYGRREFPVDGGLASYGASAADQYYQCGRYTGRVLAGAKPADLPFLQPTKFDLVINLKTAKALGLTVSNQMQLLADEVIE
jgi:putative ABC transport system substrate-binding protein